MNILVVEDKDESRYLLEVLLKGHGHTVQLSSHGAEALDLLQNEDFDLIISDILMPVMDGFELCRKVRKDSKLSHINFIFYTATYTGPKDEEFARKIGADNFVQKPCEPDEFMKIIQDVTENSGNKKPIPEIEENQEEEVLKLYNERLVRKLELKMIELEKEMEARRTAEQVLRQNEKKYKSLFNSIRDAIIITNTDMTIIDCNPAFMDLFGYSFEEISGKHSSIIFDEETYNIKIKHKLNDLNGTNNKLNNIKETDNHLYILNFRKKDGTVFPAEANKYNLRNEEGDLIGFTGIIRDITESRRGEIVRKNLESQLQQAQKMEAIGQLAGGVAHDFNNLLSVILGYSEILLDNSNTDNMNLEFMSQIHEAGIRAKVLTQQLLAFSRTQVLEMRTVNINNVLTNFEKILNRLIGEDVELEIHQSPEILTINADAAQLEQVLMNLAVNARDAMPDGGTITIKTCTADIDEYTIHNDSENEYNNYALISVTDTGSGIPGEVIEHIFEPFFTTKGKDKGTGLGLSTSYGIIKQHGGELRVASTPGQGTVFRIYLPLCEESVTVESIPLSTPSSISGSATILLVEDDPSVRRMAKHILKENGFNVIEASDTAEAIKIASWKNKDIHLLLTDVIMPSMKGPEVYEKIRQYHPDIRVLYMSGYADQTIDRHGIIKDDTCFIQKPFTGSELLEKCSQAINNDLTNQSGN